MMTNRRTRKSKLSGNISKSKKDITTKEISYEEQYPILDNVYYIKGDGANPFRVTLENDIAYIDKNTFADSDYPIWKKFRNISYKQIFVGCDNETYKGNPKYFGNTILLQISPQKYVFIGEEIFEFRSRYQIQIYESPLNYPYAYTKDKTYLIWDKLFFPTLPGKEPAEAEFIHERDNKEAIKKIDVKMIYIKDY